MEPRDREKASKGESEKGKLAGGDGHDDNEEAADDPQSSNLQSRKKRLRSLLSPFEKDELIDLFDQIGTKIPAAADEIRYSANADPRKRKISVRRLNPMTTTNSLCTAFSSFGEIEDGHVVRHRRTGKSRRHGFITFKNIESAEEALENPPEKIDGNFIECSYTLDRWARSSTTIYVSGLPLDASDGTLRSYFSKYGEIEKIDVVDERGCVFVTFKTIEGARLAYREPKKFMGKNRIFVRYTDLNPKEPKMPRIVQSEITAPLPTPPSPTAPPAQPSLPPMYAAYPYSYPNYDPYAKA